MCGRGVVLCCVASHRVVLYCESVVLYLVMLWFGGELDIFDVLLIIWDALGGAFESLGGA